MKGAVKMPDLRINRVRLHYDEMGTGEAVVFLHGLTGSGRDWSNQMNVVKEGYRAIALDFRGHGLSEAPPFEKEYSINLFAEDVYGLLGLLSIDHCCLVGHSMGGFTALQFVLEHPNMVRGLVLVDTSSGTWDNPPGFAELRARLDELAMSEGLNAAFDYDAANSPVKIEKFRRHPELRAIAERKALETSVQGYVYVPRSFQKWKPVTNRLGEIKTPTLIFRGEEDSPFIKSCDTLNDNIPMAELFIVPGAGHNPHEENPGFFNPIFMDFLDSLNWHNIKRGI